MTTNDQIYSLFLEAEQRGDIYTDVIRHAVGNYRAIVSEYKAKIEKLYSEGGLDALDEFGQMLDNIPGGAKYTKHFLKDAQNISTNILCRAMNFAEWMENKLKSYESANDIEELKKFLPELVGTAEEPGVLTRFKWGVSGMIDMVNGNVSYDGGEMRNVRRRAYAVLEGIYFALARMFSLVREQNYTIDRHLYLARAELEKLSKPAYGDPDWYTMQRAKKAKRDRLNAKKQPYED